MLVVRASPGGQVLIIDDVMSAGTAARESIALVRRPGPASHNNGAWTGWEKATEDRLDVDWRCAMSDQL
jgi:orotate phosphoribosyltransferase